MEFLAEYSLFLAKIVTVVVAVLVIIIFAAIMGQKTKKSHDKGHLTIEKLNDHYQEMKTHLEHDLFDKDVLKQQSKEQKKKDKKSKSKKKGGSEDQKPRLFVLDFHGDMKASAVSHLREEITAVLSVATEQDEVMLRLESPGGLVHAYGLAASQLQRIRDKGLKFTVAVDKVAASGGYMMACTGTQIIAAPFAVIGSIGVMAQLPNFNKLLKKNDVDIELHTAGEFKRTLTMLGENTKKGREKFRQDIQDTHELFKDFIKEAREQVDIDAVATGEIWYGQKALGMNLVDKIITSDEYIYRQVDSCDIVHVTFSKKKRLADKLGLAAENAMEKSFNKLWHSMVENRFFS